MSYAVPPLLPPNIPPSAPIAPPPTPLAPAPCAPPPSPRLIAEAGRLGARRGVAAVNDDPRMPITLRAVERDPAGEADAYAHEVVRALDRAGLRVEAELRNEKINYKVREHSLAKVPVLLVR